MTAHRSLEASAQSGRENPKSSRRPRLLSPCTPSIVRWAIPAENCCILYVLYIIKKTANVKWWREIYFLSWIHFVHVFMFSRQMLWLIFKICWKPAFALPVKGLDTLVLYVWKQSKLYQNMLLKSYQCCRLSLTFYTASHFLFGLTCPSQSHQMSLNTSCQAQGVAVRS